jgi:hypothetical protein
MENSKGGVVERSVTNLQALNNIIIALALTRAISGFRSFGVDAFLNLIVFVVTLLPFHHGASLYLYDVYTRNDFTKPFEGLLDFIFFFTEAIVFFLMGSSLTDNPFFIKSVLFLFGIDILWLIGVYLFNLSKGTIFEKVKKWLYLNIIMFVSVVFCMYSTLFSIEIRLYILALLAILRTGFDYGLQWKYYWPKET